MASEKTVTRVVSHPKLYMMHKGKMQHFEQGTELILSEEKAKKHAAKLEPVKQQKKVTVDSGDKGGNAKKAK